MLLNEGSPGRDQERDAIINGMPNSPDLAAICERRASQNLRFSPLKPKIFRCPIICFQVQISVS